MSIEAFATPPPISAIPGRDEPVEAEKMVSATREISGRDLERKEEEEDLRAVRADLVSLTAEEVFVVAIVRRRRYN